MKLSVYVLGREVATLEQVGDFKSVLTYRTDTATDEFVSLTMPVRTESYHWDDQLHPVFQMNLPEGYLLQVLQEQFGPHVGANPTALLTVVGKRMLIAWHEGVSGLRSPRTYAMGAWCPGKALTGFSAPPKLKNPKKTVVGRSELLGKK